jgi:8-oxo-dGTP pyrophosphatase MutT (NUDIX family)
VRDEDAVTPLWRPPGGRVEPGGTHLEPALRALQEETGIRIERLGPCVWQRTHVFIWQGIVYDARDYYYVAKLTKVPGSLEVQQSEQRTAAAEARWWTLAELEQSDDAFVPHQLPRLLVPIVLGKYPDEPILIEA